MAKVMSNPAQWKPGQSGNPKGRPARGTALTEILRLNGQKMINVGGTRMEAREALAKAVWQFVLTGEVGLMGKHLEANSAAEWVGAVKWLYSHIEPHPTGEREGEAELVIRVVRDEEFTPPSDASFTSPPSPLSASREGEQEEYVDSSIVTQVVLTAEGEAVRREAESDEETWL